MTGDTYSIAVFPFLKTRRAVSIGGLTFRPTDNFEGLPTQQAESVAEISSMLFLQDNFCIRSASYAIVPFVNFDYKVDVTRLSLIQSAVAYLYAIPHQIFGDPFLSTEHASMAVFSPGQVSIHLTQPTFHVDATEDCLDLSPRERGLVPGYAGLYNFKYYFWAVRGSRIYGPMPHLTLNHAQDLSADIMSNWANSQLDCRLLLNLLEKEETVTSARIFTAVRWFNSANLKANDDDAAIVNLAIAFESLLGLPEMQKTDRLIDAISLLLGRIPRLDVWARQFYDTRSRIVHEGRSHELNFVATDSLKTVKGPIYQPLLSYGRQIFRLCLGVLLVGSEQAEKAGLEDKLVTNQERFEKICRLLDDNKVSPCERLARIDALVDAVERYRFLSESSLKLETMISAAQLAAKAFLACESSPLPKATQSLEALVAAKRRADHFNELDAISELNAILRANVGFSETQYGILVGKLVAAVWNYVFNHYFWLKERSSTKSPE